MTLFRVAVFAAAVDSFCARARASMRERVCSGMQLDGTVVAGVAVPGVVAVLVAMFVFVAVVVVGFLLLVADCACCGVLMRGVVAWVVHEFLFETNSRSAGRSAAASDFAKQLQNDLQCVC